MKLNKKVIIGVCCAPLFMSSVVHAKKTRTCDGEINFELTAIYKYQEDDGRIAVRKQITSDDSVLVKAEGQAILANKARREAREKLVRCWEKVAKDNDDWDRSPSSCDVEEWMSGESIEEFLVDNYVDDFPFPERENTVGYYAVDLYFDTWGGSKDCNYRDRVNGILPVFDNT